MPGKRPEPEVTTRQLTPEATDQEGMLYRPVPQLEQFPPPFEFEYVWFTPELAAEWVQHGNSQPDFRQRPISKSQVRRWKTLYTSNRFVHFLPNQAICVDDDDMMMNGMHRLTGLMDCPEGLEAGFIVIRNVPRWMFSFFDTNKSRSLKDVFHIGAKPSDPQTGSAMRLSMRYEEFLLGARKATGWRHWASISDEHQDVDLFYDRRDEIQDWYSTAEKVYRFSRVLIPSVMAFRFYQGLAWPDGDERITEFLESLVTAKGLTPRHPASHLRRFTLDTYTNREKVPAKRELHLAMLLRTFALTMNSTRLERFDWAYGQPMSMPYHPKGAEVAIKNVRSALDEMDREHGAA